MVLTSVLTGFALSLSLILAIGAQNAFVLRQGLHKEHVWIVCSICTLSDGILILFGVYAVGDAVSQGGYGDILKIGAVIFLLGYAVVRFYSSIAGSNGLMADDQRSREPMGRTVLLTMGFTWLNPHVYLDTILIIGGSAVDMTELEKLAFSSGAITASFIFFFALGFGASRISNFIKSPASWRVIDFVIGVTMLGVAAGIWFG